MTPADSTAISRLVRRVRNRLWFGSTLRLIGLSLWVSALLLLGLGLIHLTLRSTAPGTAATVLLPPLLAGLFSLIRRRPSLPEACRYADHLAGAQSLLLSTWDLLQRPSAIRGAAPLVLAHARRQLPSWQLRIDATRPPRTRIVPTEAVAIALIGGLLLLLPGKEGGAPAHPVMVATSDTDDWRGSSLTDLIQALPAPAPDSPANQPRRRDPADNRGQSGRTNDQVPDPREAATIGNAISSASTEAPARQNPPSGHSPVKGGEDTDRLSIGQNAVRSVGDGEVKGDGTGDSRDPSDQAKRPEHAASLQSVPVPLQRELPAASPVSSGVNLSGTLLARFSRSSAPASEPSVPTMAVLPEQGLLRLDPGPVEQRYIARYFQQLKIGSTE